ncbi:hypothetical protein PHIM7_360 [Sinorhizobium phage phiM7]|uniref:Uncharacterized protein n=2 Tax=Emdodecavirus TaxID=1980937 RepID=S5M7M6_9CAUD|nr:hypothetical protein AB690_gp155 [Sinorhizobium phage phiM12]YP_009601485.1 hypothetical protein FDH46_gp118 [Sinorhizobium phage phiM7]AGR48096.1 hypothetical protein SmphiM12_464 [Sinorhizobium phage phiM12]AKF12905.1 hypothetical protein PHIM7_360 [Sinorhizobium phage phiM7]AKF13265.1 hypothetical protein PHIM19_360 [Sinorhizobium phage phiM19]
MKSLTDELNQLRLVAFMTNKETDKEAYYKALSHAFQNWELVSVEDLQSLINEYRPGMDKDVLHSWAQDVIAAIKARIL